MPKIIDPTEKAVRAQTERLRKSVSEIVRNKVDAARENEDRILAKELRSLGAEINAAIRELGFGPHA